MEIKDKVIILTGTARIGLDVARKLLGKDAKLVVAYFTTKPNLGADVHYVQADLSKNKDCEKVVKESLKKFGRIDAVVHMAANYKASPWMQVKESDWDESMNAIAKSAFLMSKAAADKMNEGRIVLFSDWSVLNQPYKNYLAYNVAKSAVIGLTKSLAKELAPKITVNAIAPGPILKPADLSDEENSEVLKNTPLGKWGGESEITKAVLYLLEADFVTGQVLYVDGGRSIA